MAEHILNKNSSRKDVSSYIENFNSRGSFSEDDIKELLENLVALEIDSYNFSIGANIASRTINKSIIVELEKYMAGFNANTKKNDEDYDNAFVAYYLLTYYYRTYEKLEAYSNALNLYQSYFEAQTDRYALAYQIKARYLRKNGDGERALTYDRKAVELLKRKQIDNIHVRITLAATIAIALENRDIFISEKDIEDSFETVQNAIILNSEYAKYRYLWAKLKMFSLLYKNDRNQLNGIDYAREIRESKRLLRDAIELEDAKADAYPTSVIEYRSYMRAADLVLSEIKLTVKIKMIESTQNESIQQRFDSNRINTENDIRNTQNEISDKLEISKNAMNLKIDSVKDNFQTMLTDTKSSFENQLKQSQEKYLEILGVIVSIVAVIMVVIGTYSAKLSITAILVATFGMSVGMIGVYSAFLILLKDQVGKKYIIFLITSIVIEVSTIAVSIFWPIFRNWL